MLLEGFDLADVFGMSLWGIYNVANPFYMQGKPEHTLRAMIDGVFMAITYAGDKFDESFALKEDFEYSCRMILRDGGTLIRNRFVADYSVRNAGGCRKFWDDAGERADTCNRLIQKYPSILRRHSRRPDEIAISKKGIKNGKAGSRRDG